MRYLLTVLTLIFFGFQFPCHAESKIEQFDEDIEDLFLAHLSSSAENLKNGNFSLALKELQKWSTILEGFDTHPAQLDALILFGKVIACDNLKQEEICHKHLVKLQLVVDGIIANTQVESVEEDTPLPVQEYQQVLQIIVNLCTFVDLAHSKEVKKELLLIVNKVLGNIQEKVSNCTTVA